MKVGRISTKDNKEALAVVVEQAGGSRVLDVSALALRRPELFDFPTSMADLMMAGPSGLEQVYAAIEWARREGEEAWFQAEPDVKWLLPVAVRNCIAAGRNFRKHRAEGMAYWEAQGAASGFHDEIPSAFAKLPTSMVPTRSTVQRPANVDAFDYEIEVAAVIGKPGLCVSEARALDLVFGYTILNDLSAREWQRSEMKNQMILLGKNFPGFGPLGPWILTADEVADPAALNIELRVNDEVRQQATCDDLIFSFPQMIAHWSQIGLDAGDLITSGTPEGVANSRKPDPSPYFLKPGDKVEAIVDQIGVLETSIA